MGSILYPIYIYLRYGIGEIASFTTLAFRFLRFMTVPLTIASKAWLPTQNKVCKASGSPT